MVESELINEESQEDEESIKKRIKKDNELIPVQPVDKEAPPPKPERCVICKQYSDDVLLYNGHPNNSAPEYVALTDEKLMLFTGDEEEFNQHDERPTNKITYFNVYDTNGHLCPFDIGIIEQNKALYFSGYIKPVYEEDSSPEGGIPAHDMGPINEWYISGYDGGEKAIVGFSTGYAEYYLMTPSPDYQPLMKIVNEKISLSKLVIEFLLDEIWQTPTYEDLLQRLQTCGDEALNEEVLLRHAQFVCDQVVSFDAAAEITEDKPLITAPCMRSLIKIAGVTFQKRKWMTRLENKGIKNKQNKPQWTKATTTTLVCDVFESFFADQMANNEKDVKGPKKKRCGVCEACQLPDCGTCNHCRDMLKFGGTGRSKQACKQRRCPNMAIQDAEESDNEGEDVDDSGKCDVVDIPCSKSIVNTVKWIGDPAEEHHGRTYYNSVQIGDSIITTGDCVMLNSNVPGRPFLIAKLSYMWDQQNVGPTFHAHVFIRGLDTVIGETADARELFLTDHCENCPLGSIVKKAIVERVVISPDWYNNGGIDKLPQHLEDDGQTFYFSKRYQQENARFEDVTEDDIDSASDISPCSSCRRKQIAKKLSEPKHEEGKLFWMGDVYKPGTGVYLNPNVFKFKKSSDFSYDEKDEVLDQDLYPEAYRKTSDNIKGSNIETPEPFCIGLIKEIYYYNPKDIKVRVHKFYRAENTHKGVFLSYQSDLNILYWSDEEVTIAFEEVVGKCYIAFGDILEMSARDWIDLGPNRFYFTQAYNLKAHCYEDVPDFASKIGLPGKGKGKGKGKSTKKEAEGPDLPPTWERLDVPLNCMDVFAGCGGLSEGLHQSGVATTKWAIEKEAAAAQAYRLNNPDTKVFSDDCNDILKLVMNGEGKEKGLPCKGDVQLLVGGPPCQGFSGMNRFNAGQYSLFKNSLIASYLSYCDYYRPKYFILENVRNFVSFKKSLVLKLTMRCLLAMGYQVTFGIVQAGHYGVPQTRRRLIILAAAPGCLLPKYPEPLHVFNKRGCQLSVQVGDHRYTNGTKWTTSAPFRTINVRDAMSDLPDIKNGSAKREMAYDSEPMSHFQRIMRRGGGNTILKEHICKEMAPLVEARMTHIPLAAGSDWRSLPNIVVRLSDGSHTNKLRYPHMSKKQNKGETPKAVCQCATGKGPCDPSDRQFNTLIPWCLPHTGDRHNHWAGLYGRLEWDGFFSTTVTNPEPMGKQGRVLHPDQHRVVSVRECARSQGFPDRYQFAGTVLDKHRQVGNAVPPPLGIALGREIKKAYFNTKPKN